MSDDLAKLQLQVRQFCNSPCNLLLNEGSRTFLINLFKALCGEEDAQKRNRLEQMIGMVRRSSKMDAIEYSLFLGSMAYAVYRLGDTVLAEYLFRRACDLSDDNTSLNNNLAYVLRRSRNDSLNSSEIISLLLPGVRKHEPYCLINMGLLFALSLSTPKDWRTADELFSLLPNELNGSDNWWENIGKNDEIEGLLVHFFLLRHRKIDHSELGSINSLVQRLTQRIDEFPNWLAADYAIE